MSLNNDHYKAGFAEHYADNASPVWDIGKPQQPFITHAEQIQGPILDIGCGTGSVAIFFARRGEEVTAIDFVDDAVARASQKAQEAGVNVHFRVQDFFTLDTAGRKYKSIIDSGLLHIFSGDEQRKQQYVSIVSQLLDDDGRLFLLASRKSHAGDNGLTAEEIYATFSDALIIESLEEFVAETVPGAAEEVSGKVWLTWFVVIKKAGPAKS